MPNKGIRAVCACRSFNEKNVHSPNDWMAAQGTVSMTSFLCSQMACGWCYTRLNECMCGRRRRDLSLAMESHCEAIMMV